MGKIYSHTFTAGFWTCRSMMVSTLVCVYSTQVSVKITTTKVYNKKGKKRHSVYKNKIKPPLKVYPNAMGICYKYIITR